MLSIWIVFPTVMPPAFPSARHLGIGLLVLMAALAALSADQAARLGLASLRMPAFVLACGTLVLLGVALRPWLDPATTRAPMLLLLILALIALADLQGPVDPIDYKLVLPVLALLAAGPVARLLHPLDLSILLWRLMALYVLATAVLVALVGPGALAKGDDGIARIDASGSLVTHSALCTIALLLAATTWKRARCIGRVVRLGTGILALLMLLAAATRTPLVTLAILAVLLLATTRARGVWLRRMALLALAGFAVLQVYAALVDDTPWRRLWSDGQPEWSTGRAVAVQDWLARADGHPFGLGLGTVRATLADGKPSLDGQDILDWPHNELVRLWVEAGPLGAAFLLVVLGTLCARAVRVARQVAVDAWGPDPAAGMLALGLAADAIAQSLFQNWLNGVYHATFGVLVIALLDARTRIDAQRREAA
jgi:hypothetical protein